MEYLSRRSCDEEKGGVGLGTERQRHKVKAQRDKGTKDRD